MSLIVSFIFMLVVIISLAIVAYLNKKSYFYNETESLKRNLIKNIILVFITFPMIIAFVFSLKPGGADLILDQFHITIIKDDIAILDDLDNPILQYPVYKKSVTQYGTYFYLNNPDKFDKYITGLSIYNSKFTDNNYEIYTLTKNNTQYYVYYNLEENNYYLAKSVIYFQKDSVYEEIPLIPCSYFFHDTTWSSTNLCGTFTTSLNWNEIKLFYNKFDENTVTIDDTNSTITYTDSETQNSFLITFHNPEIVIARIVK